MKLKNCIENCWGNNMIKEYQTYYKSKIGTIKITGTENAITSLDFVENEERNNMDIPDVLVECVKQIDEYFQGYRKDFSVKIQLEGTDFQKKVWNELLKIPFGKTVSYMDIAKSIGNEKSVRAVGKANGDNKIAIIIPCHRVIGSNGNLIGYGGGLWRKEWLLKHEKQLLIL